MKNGLTKQIAGVLLRRKTGRERQAAGNKKEDRGKPHRYKMWTYGASRRPGTEDHV